MCAAARLGHSSRRDEGRLRALAATLDPLALLDEIRAVQHHLAGLAAGSTVHPMPQRDADLDGFLRGLALAWRAGEVRPTHRPRKKPPRHWVPGRTRSTRRGLVSSSGSRRNRIGRRRISSAVCGWSTRGCSSRASSGLRSAQRAGAAQCLATAADRRARSRSRRRSGRWPSASHRATLLVAIEKAKVSTGRGDSGSAYSQLLEKAERPFATRRCHHALLGGAAGHVKAASHRGRG